nr:MAG TPA: hypothetical protein [Caudoviricetes sp.]
MKKSTGGGYLTIEKNGTVYTVRESDRKWTVSTEKGRLSVSYDVPKELCGTEEALREYVRKEAVFG